MLRTLSVLVLIAPCWSSAFADTAAVAAAPYCAGDYADDNSSLSSDARRLEESLPSYTFCIRTTATYECPSYGQDGNLRRKKRRVVAHGTGFAYQQENGGTLLLTNQHVADWPAVTDEEHRVDDVPLGCKRVTDALAIVDDENDSYDRDDVPLQRVVVDPQLDIAILKTKVALPVSPWKIGHSNGLHERNVVNVRGFPLGVFKATNVGKVISAHDHDSYNEWEHDDFVVDALLSPGNSGSPVFAISCKTGEFELVGVYHAGYTRGSALNLVIGIDQVRDLMATHKRSLRPRLDTSTVTLNRATRGRLAAQSRASIEPFFLLSNFVAAVRAREDGALVYEVLNRDFPLRAYPIVVLEDLPARDADEFGTPGRIWLGGRQGLKPYLRADLDTEAQAQIDKLLDALRRNSVAAFAMRALDVDQNSEGAGSVITREQYERSTRLEQNFVRANAGYGDLATAISELAERSAPQAAEIAVNLRDVLDTKPLAISVTPTPVARNADAAPTRTKH